MSKYRLDFIADANTVALMDDLKADFNCAGEGYADLFKKCLGLAKVALEAGADSDGVILVYPKGQEDQAIALDLRN